MKVIIRKNVYRLNWIDIFTLIMFVIYVVTYSATLVFWGMGQQISNWRYYILAIAVIISFILLLIKFKYRNYKKRDIIGKELLFTVITALVFLLFSILKAYKANTVIPFRTYVQISLFVLPALYAFGIINIIEKEKVYWLMGITSVICIMFYFTEPLHGILDFLDFNNWKNISYLKSVSFTESSYFAESFLQLFLFFNYFKNIENDKSEKKYLNIFSVITFVFTILSFKRLGMLFAIVIIIVQNIQKRIAKKSRNFPINMAIIFSIIFVILTVVYTKFMQGEIFTTVDAFKLTSGRNWILSLWAKSGYYTYGYGSSMLVMGRYLEMDLVQIFLELNYIAVFLFCFTFFRVAKKNVYASLVMIYTFTNMLTASSLPMSLGWVIMLISISCMASDGFCDVKSTRKKSDYE